MRHLIAGAVLMACAGGAQAGGTFDSAGKIHGQSSSKYHQLSEGHMVMELTGTQDSFEMAADGHPFAGLSGTCTGGVVIMGAVADGSGVCQYKNDAGDTAFVRWMSESLTAERAVQGSWVMIGGTGALGGITGGGRYTSLTDRSTGKTEATLTGAVTLP